MFRRYLINFITDSLLKSKNLSLDLLKDNMTVLTFLAWTLINLLKILSPLKI